MLSTFDGYDRFDVSDSHNSRPSNGLIESPILDEAGRLIGYNLFALGMKIYLADDSVKFAITGAFNFHSIDSKASVLPVRQVNRSEPIDPFGVALASSALGSVAVQPERGMVARSSATEIDMQTVVAASHQVGWDPRRFGWISSTNPSAGCLRRGLERAYSGHFDRSPLGQRIIVTYPLSVLPAHARPIHEAKANISSATIKTISSDVHKLSILRFSPVSLARPMPCGRITLSRQPESGI